METVHNPPGNSRPKVGRPSTDPASLAARRVRYYRDPLTRVKELHEHRSELTTGLVYRSPFA